MTTLPTILTENIKLANHLTVQACFDWFNHQAALANTEMTQYAESVPVEYVKFALARERQATSTETRFGSTTWAKP